MREEARSARRSVRRTASRTKAYVDGMSSDDDEENAKEFDPLDIIRGKDFPAYFVKEMQGEEFDVEYVQRTGFNTPLFFRDTTGLHMKVPGPSFTVTDVKNLIGNKRIIEVMNCATQLNAEMTMKDFEEFFTSPDRDGTLLNVISLEFSHTRLDAYVESPRVVRQIDLIANAWPRHLKDNQEESTNDMSKMLYPKVQKYCLMSVAGCWTDFHIDFGGTSVWYHLIKGEKHFWLIPPTPANLKAYEAWTFSGKQSDTFFGDIVEKCGYVVLRGGNTFMIPAGWIHAVYTPEDSLVMGGNFLHPYGVEKFLKCAHIEEVTKVQHKYRFPFYTELMWYTLDKYAYALLGRHHLNLEEDEEIKLFGDREERKAFLDKIGHPHLTPYELTGIRAIVLYLHALPGSKKNVPSLLKDPVSLVKDMRTIVEAHKDDKHERAATGRPLLFWPGIKNDPATCGFKQTKVQKEKSLALTRIKLAEGMMLHPEEVCVFCGLDGWHAQISETDIDRPQLSNQLLECTDCHEVTHPACFPSVMLDKGVVNIDLPNSWLCSKCVHRGPLKVKCAPRNVDMAASVKVDHNEPIINIKEEPVELEAAKECRINNMEDEKLAAFKNDNLNTNAIRAVCSSDNLLLMIFHLVGTIDLMNCGLVCKNWLNISRHKSLSNTRCVNLAGLKLTPRLLFTIVKEQPLSLSLDWSSCGRQHLTWLLSKIPNCSRLSLVGLNFASTVSALSSSNCTSLQSLNLSYVSNLTDISLHKLLTTPHDSHLSQSSRKPSLPNLKTLSLQGTDVSDVSLRYVSQYLPNITSLAVSGCRKISDDGLAQLVQPNANATLQSLDVSGCNVTDVGLYRLLGCQSLVRIDVQGTRITREVMEKFVRNSQHKLKVFGRVIAKDPSA